MAIKLCPSTIIKRFPIWVISTSSHSSSALCANSSETVTETKFEEELQLLRNKPLPGNLIRVLDNTQDLSFAVKIFKWAFLQTQFCHTPETYCRILQKLGFAGNVEELERLCKNMAIERIPGTKEALLALIDEFVQHRRLSEALLVLVTMTKNGCVPSLGTFNALMCALVKEKREFQDVLLVYKEMAIAELSPNVETLNCLLEALIDSDRVEVALNQLERMEKKGLSPNSRSFEILIKGLFAKNQVDKAIKILREMFDCRCNPDLSFFRCVIPLFCRGNKPKVGMRLFWMMKDRNFEPDSLIFSALIECLCENLIEDEAITVYKDMIKVGLLPPMNVVVDLVNMFCELGKVDEAAKFLEERGILETCPYNALLDGCYRAGEFSMAMGILRKMSKGNVDDCDSWSAVIRLACEQQGIKRASELLGRMFRFSISPDCDTYSALVFGNCKSTKYKNALKLFHHIKANSWVLDSMSYSKLVEGLCSVELVPEAAELFSYMTHKGYSLETISFNTLIKGVCDTGKLGEAIELCQLGYFTDTFCASSTYTMIMRILLKENRPTDATVVFSRMLKSGCDFDLDAYCVLIESMSLLSRIKDCVSLFNTMIVDKGLVPDSERLLCILSHLADHHELHAISCSIDKLVLGEAMNTSMYNILICGLWRDGYKNEARRLLDLMLKKGLSPDSKTHGLLIGYVDGECAQRKS